MIADVLVSKSSVALTNKKNLEFVRFLARADADSFFFVVLKLSRRKE